MTKRRSCANNSQPCGLHNVIATNINRGIETRFLRYSNNHSVNYRDDMDMSLHKKKTIHISIGLIKSWKCKGRHVKNKDNH